MRENGTSPGGPNSGTRPAQAIPEIPSELLQHGTDWDRILAMSDEEALQNALADEDSPPMTPQQLARMRRAPNPRAIRQRFGMTQKEFARQFQISVGTLRDWEQGLHAPDSTATAFLRVIEREPQAVLRALHPETAECDVERPRSQSA